MNSFVPIDPARLDYFPAVHDGYPDDLAAEDTVDVLRDVCGAATRDFPESWWIEPEDWADKARDNDKYHTWPINYVDRFTNQQPTDECTCHSLTRCMEGAWNLQRGIIYPEGPKKDFRYEESSKGSIWFSPLSVYAEANPRQWGGANVRQVMEIAVRRGILPDKIQPKDYKFKHTLQGTCGKGNSNQSSGGWISVANFPSGWNDTSKLFRPLEVIFPESWEQAVCIVLNGRLVGVGRDGHAIPWARLIFEGNKLTAGEYPDSYDLLRYDSLATIKRAWQGSFAIASMTAPDDWENPAA